MQTAFLHCKRKLLNTKHVPLHQVSKALYSKSSKKSSTSATKTAFPAERPTISSVAQLGNFGVKNFKSNLDRSHPLFTPNEVEIGEVNKDISRFSSIPSNIAKPKYCAPFEKVQLKSTDDFATVNGAPNSSEPYYYSNYQFHTPTSIKAMRKSCQLARKVLHFSGTLVKEGVTTDEIDRQVHEFIVKHGAYPSPLSYGAFPKSVCTSVNEVMCHGIPDSRPLKNGDIINIDVTVYFEGYHGDTSATFKVGDVRPEIDHLVKVAEMTMYEAIQRCGPNTLFSSIGEGVDSVLDRECKDKNYYFISSKSFTGHGIGGYFHGFPQVFFFRNKLNSYVGPSAKMQPGMIFTIEPIINSGTEEFVTLPDKWTIIAADKRVSAQFEHTILITDNGVEILTFDEEHDKFNPFIKKL